MSYQNRKSRPLQRKTSHSLIERRRREKINEGLVSLQQLVPACREELRENLLTKAQTNKKNARKSSEEIEAIVEEDMAEKVGTCMVLEKLVSTQAKCVPVNVLICRQCIISHTVDYVRELQETVASYRQMYGSSPPLPGISGSRNVTHSHAHEEDVKFEGEEDGEVTAFSDLSEERSSKEYDDQETLPRTNWTRCHAKCQRHWGSNNPIKLNSHWAKNNRHSRSNSESAQREEFGLLTAQDPSGGRAHSVDGETTLEEAAAREKTESESDFELDDWEESKHLRRTSNTYTLAASSPRKRSRDQKEELLKLPQMPVTLYTDTEPWNMKKKSKLNDAEDTCTSCDTSKKSSRIINKLPKMDLGLGLLADLSSQENKAASKHTVREAVHMQT